MNAKLLLLALCITLFTCMYLIQGFDDKDNIEAIMAANHTPYGPNTIGVVRIDIGDSSSHSAGVMVHEIWHSLKNQGIKSLDVPYASAAGFYHEYYYDRNLKYTELLKHLERNIGLESTCLNLSLLLRKYSNQTITENNSTYVDGARLAGYAFSLSNGKKYEVGFSFISLLADGVDPCIASQIVLNPELEKFARNYIRGVYIQLDYENLYSDIHALDDTSQAHALTFIEHLDNTHISILKYLPSNISNNRDGRMFVDYYKSLTEENDK
jgi:hypothetical protein